MQSLNASKVLAKIIIQRAIRARKNRLKELESYLLPLLRQQITNLLKPLHRLRLAATQPCPSLKWILEIQSEIDTTTNQIKDTLNQLRCKESNTSPHNEEDQDRKEFKYFRTVELGLSTDEIDPVSDFSWRFNLRESLKDLTHRSNIENQDMIDWITGSEFHLIQNTWKYDARSSKDDFDPIYRFIAFKSNQQTAPPYQSHHSQLLRHILLVLKLSKLFFTKLSDRAINNNHDLLESSFTRINSKHLTKLLNLYSMVHYCIHEIADIIAHRNYAFPSIGQEIESLKTCFETRLSLVSNHFLPMIKARSDGLSAQDYYQDWLVTWSVQYNLAIQHFKDAFQSSSSNHS
ncbi:hypothetical protein Pst134EB_014042 [Puccinia striiformis f. sp. tritici]|nr:hypothetical protein Pst134EB_014042 [Puccinia striiformis f. sp. tritici]